MKKIVEVKDLRLLYPDSNRLVLKDVTVSFHEGEKVLITGPSGGGKSTLLQVLAGIIPHSIDVPLKAKELLLPDSWGYVFQDPDSQFCMPYVDEEIAFVLENLNVPYSEMKQRIQEVMSEVGLRLENIHTKIAHLSGGMKQRLAIASVLALHPKVLLLDEPTAMLDPEGTEQVWETVQEISQNRTVIIVEHKLQYVLDYIDRIVLLNDQGEVVADGDKDYVLKHYQQDLKRYGIWYPNAWNDYKKERKIKHSSFSQEDKPIIQLSDFKGYRGRKEAIAIEKADVYKGECIAIRGENGAGKSTLLHSLMQLLKTTGTYRVLGENAKKFKVVSKSMMMVFQNPEHQFVANSVFDEMAYSLKLQCKNKKEINKKVEEMLKQFNLYHLKEQHPYHLSVGQKKRLSVASSLIANQPIILLDEPTFGQDLHNTINILEVLEGKRSEGTTIIMVTHSEEIINQFATRVWEIKNGGLVSNSENNKVFNIAII
ncbi:ABC transporter [Bacillus sp. MUM 116]|uniref:ABC transporter ATP-binding protein n=1 Tax=Bacillus sp. MUM 116 TaxID=1678002 RepID=UPI0008F5630D|nr:ABC transporter ATP-binding protein [Bacillus sp. MUM 116]OIK16874.1 ABC transporter [Bacillus sp. MUM 116]